MSYKASWTGYMEFVKVTWRSIEICIYFLDNNISYV